MGTNNGLKKCTHQLPHIKIDCCKIETESCGVKKSTCVPCVVMVNK